jgi:hypothetical protein
MYNVDETVLFNMLMPNGYWHSEVNHTQAVEVHDTGLLCWCVQIRVILINYQYWHSKSAEAHTVSTVLPCSDSWLGDNLCCKNSLTVAASVGNVGQHCGGSLHQHKHFGDYSDIHCG